MAIVINKNVVNKIVSFCNAGLCAGLGGKLVNDRNAPAKGRMCVEAAVWAATEDDGESDIDDSPSCVDLALSCFKVDLNDSCKFESKKQRGRFLRRIAVAQLGTRSKGYRFSYSTFRDGVVEMWTKRGYDTGPWYGYGIPIPYQGGEKLATLIEDAVQVLKDMKTPGSKYLHLAPLPKEIRNYKRPV